MSKALKENKSLRESLAESLKQAVPSNSEGIAVPVPTAASGEKPLVQSAADDFTTIPTPGKLVRATIALKPNETQKAEQILDLLMSSRKRRGSMSEAISIALRLCPVDGDQIGRASDENRAADRRKSRGKHKV